LHNNLKALKNFELDVFLIIYILLSGRTEFEANCCIQYLHIPGGVGTFSWSRVAEAVGERG
jgi:hypothetical protein